MQEFCPDVYYMESWGIANANRDDGVYERYQLETPNGVVVYPYVKRKIAPLIHEEQYFDIITPRGFNGPLIISSTNKAALLTEFDDSFNKHCRDNKIVSEYVRFSPWLKNHEYMKEYYDIQGKKQTYFVDLQTDFFNAEFSSKGRGNIRKAMKSNIDIQFNFNDDRVVAFLSLYNKTVAKNQISNYNLISEAYLRKLFALMQDNIMMVSAIYQGKFISSIIVLFCENYVHGYLSGNDYEYKSLYANSLLLYEVATWAKTNGIKEFHLGGAGTEELVKFKKKFTKNGLLDFFVGTKIRNQAIYDKLVEINGRNTTGFFPEYR